MAYRTAPDAIIRGGSVWGRYKSESRTRYLARGGDPSKGKHVTKQCIFE